MIITQVLTEKAITLLQALARGEEPPVFTSTSAAEEASASSEGENTEPVQPDEESAA